MAMICMNRSRECDGCFDCKIEPETPICDVCGKEAEIFYYDKHKDFVGCDECIKIKDAWEEVAESA